MGRGRRGALFTVYKNKKNDDSLIALDLTARQCAAIMNVNLKTFYETLCRSKHTPQAWVIIKTEKDAYELDE